MCSFSGKYAALRRMSRLVC